MTDITCSNCHRLNRSSATYCRYCGIKLYITDSSQTSQEADDFLNLFLPFLVGSTAFLIVFASVALPIFMITRNLLNPNVYKKALDEKGFYEQSLNLVIQELRDNVIFVDLIPANIWETLAQFIPPDFIKSQIENGIDQLFDYINKDTPSLTIIISSESLLELCSDTNEPKTQKRPCTLLEFLDPSVDCDRKLLPTFDINPCQIIIASLPKNFDLAKLFDLQAISKLNEFVNRVKLMRFISGLCIFAAIISLIISLAFSEVRLNTSLMIWICVAFCLSGLLCILNGLSIRILIPLLTDVFIGRELGLLLNKAVIDIGDSIASSTTRNMFFLGLGMLLIGVIMLSNLRKKGVKIIPW